MRNSLQDCNPHHYNHNNHHSNSDANNKRIFFIAGSTTATTRVISHQVFNRVAELLILANLLAIQLPLMVKRYNIDTHLRESNTLAKLTHPLTMLRDTCIRAMYTAIMKLEANIVCVNVSMLCKITSGRYLMSSFRGDQSYIYP